ncbi:MAG: sialidase family protein, partial [Chloroflexota bacterium]
MLSFVFLKSINAQENNDDPIDLGWAQPQNLSQSGLTSSPKLVGGAGGELYAFWQNQSDGYIISTLQSDGNWSSPVTSEPPFGTRAFEINLPSNQPVPLYDPLLLGSDEVGIAAFWLNGENQLRYSRYVTGSIASLASWSGPVNIFNDVVQSSALIDEQSQIHVAYVSNGDGLSIQPGIYYRSSSDNGVTWSEAIPVYISSFFRQVAEDNANVDLFLTGNNTLSIAFDDPVKEQTLFSRFTSNSGGQGAISSWSTPFVIDGRRASDRPNAEGPKEAQAIEFEGQIHAFWIAGHGDVDCALYTRRSLNQGVDWEFVEKLTDEVSDCPSYYQLLETNDQLILFTRSQTRIEIRFWEVEGWSSPINQLNLLEYQDPFSLRMVVSSCPYELAVGSADLYAMGCGAGNTNDIWVSSRPVSELQVVVNSGDIWRQAETVLANNNLMFSANMEPDIQGFLHAVWTQNDQGYSAVPLVLEPANGIYYSRNDQGLWSAPSKIIEPDGTAENVSLTYERNAGKLFVVWQDTPSQQILFSQAAATSAFNPRDWSEPIAIPAPFSNPSYPDVTVARNGAIYVAYSVPYNDGIGIYIVFSRDDGRTWTDPIPVLSESTPWDILIKPKLAFEPGGSLHLAF